MYDFGELLREYRLKKHWTQKRLAERIGVSEATISKYESNQVPPPFEKMRAIAVALNVSADILFGLEPHRTIPTQGLTAEQIQIINDLTDIFRDQNDPVKKKTSEDSYRIIGKIAIQITKTV